MALAVVTNLSLDTNQFTWLGYGTRAAALFLVGVLVGSFVDRGRELEGELAPHRNLSLDLIATADFERPPDVGQRRLGHDARLRPGRAARESPARPRAPR